MGSITQERINELKKLYDEIKAACLLIDNKYSLVATEPPLDMPESLNLKPLVFTPKSEQELRALAERSVEATFISKQRSLSRSYSSALKTIASESSKLNADADVKMAKALADYNDEKETIRRKVIDNGLYFSTVATRYTNLATARYNEDVKAIVNDLNARHERLEQRQTDAEQLYEESCASLEQERQASVEAAYQRLSEEQEKQRISVEKYNTGLVEKEQKYQASRAKAYEAAYRAQQNKALQNAKMYAELGETGYRDLIQREKYAVCKSMCMTLTRTEATVLTGFDSFLVSELGAYYSAFVNWINTTLLPD